MKWKIDKMRCEQDEVRALSAAEVSDLLLGLPQWLLKDKAIEREFNFGDFTEAMEFVNRVAVLAEAEDHHPDICVSYNKVRLTLSTHKVGGLSCKDFVLGAKIDESAGSGR